MLEMEFLSVSFANGSFNSPDLIPEFIFVLLYGFIAKLKPSDMVAWFC